MLHSVSECSRTHCRYLGAGRHHRRPTGLCKVVPAPWFCGMVTLGSLQVVLAGGSCRIPRLQQLLQEQFPSARLLLSLPPPEVVASGAALEAGLLTGRDVGQAPHPQLQCAATDLWIAVCASEL